MIKTKIRSRLAILLLLTITGTVSAVPSNLYWQTYRNQDGTIHTLYHTEGNIGIGTDSPETGYKLDINGRVGLESLDVRTNLTIGDTLTTENITIQNNITASTMNIGSLATPAGYVFSVDGKMIAEEVRVLAKVNGGWPDYVFSPDYYLRPLDELENYITQNQHLPEIPSSEEVEERGIELGDMQAKLLKKIEELTLYAIGQEKKIKKIEAEKVRDLKENEERIEELQRRVRELLGREYKN